MKVLVTGGAGFIGSRLVARLAGTGHAVRVLDNFSTGRPANLDAVDVDLVSGDVRDVHTVRAVMKGIKAVFHVAALPSVARSWTDPVSTLAVNAHGTANVIDAAIASGVGTLVYSSSSSVYGDQPEPRKAEDLVPKPVSPYGYSKLLGEKIVLAHARAGDIRVVSLRYFNVFGPRQDPTSPYAAVIPLFIRHAISGSTADIHGDGRQTRDFTYVDNVVQANLLALQSGATGLAVNIACGQSRSLLDLVTAISSLNSHPLKVRHVAPRQGDIRDSLADVTQAERKLGYRPHVSFETGLKLTYEAFRAS
jgi:UDP-N-acetylglucosamine/UDP-N-acetyl-alpha-D-glucosaminouronate 4-epimerase